MPKREADFIATGGKKNNNDPTPYEKLTFSNFLKWNMVVGTGVYIDDIEKGVEKEK